MNDAKRVFSLDIVRGGLLLWMTWVHWVHWFYEGSNPLLIWSQDLGNMFIFSTLMVIAGASGYYSWRNSNGWKLDWWRLVKRLWIYWFGYYVVAGVGLWALGEFSTERMVGVLVFRELVPFTEFLAPYLFLALFRLPFGGLWNWSTRDVRRLIVSCLVLFCLSRLVFEWVSVPVEWEGWKAVLVGAEGWFSFPLLVYLPLYLAGWFWGRECEGWELRRFKRAGMWWGGILGLVVLVDGIIAWWWKLPLFERWPPGVGFLLLGVLFTLGVFALVYWLDELRTHVWTRRWLLLWGQNAFGMFLMHTLFLFGFVGLGVDGSVSVLLVLVGWLSSILVALYFVRVLPLNYSLTLTLYDWCACEITGCSHVEESVFKRRIKRGLLGLFNLRRLLVIRVGGREVRLWWKRSGLVALGVVMLVATPLGVAEEDLILRERMRTVDVDVSKRWVLVEDQGTALRVSFRLPEALEADEVMWVIDGMLEGEMRLGEDWNWEARIDIRSLDVGRHEVWVKAVENGRVYESRETILYVSEPMYVTWTIDWEGFDVDADYLAGMERIADVRGLPLTHMWNPRIYTTSSMSQERAEELTKHIKLRLIQGDELGMHLHMFPDFVETAGVVPKWDPKWGGFGNEGYDILTSTYGEEDMVKILEEGLAWFERKGLPRPTMYRAGGWFASEDTLKALEKTGFEIDSSGRTAYVLGNNRYPGTWALDVHQLPYYPNVSDKNSDREPRLDILEIPNNGGDDLGFTAGMMIDRFKELLGDGVLRSPEQVTIVSHPHWFDGRRQEMMEEVFETIDGYLYDTDLGAVKYVGLSVVGEEFGS